MKHLTTIVCLAIAALTHAQEIFSDGKSAYALAPADVISSGVVNSIQISSNSRYVIYRKAVIDSIDQVIVGEIINSGPWFYYDRVSKQSSQLKLPNDVSELMILGDGIHAFFCSNTNDGPQGFIDLKTGAISATNISIANFVYGGEEAKFPFLMFQDDKQGVQIIPPVGQPLSFTLPPKVRVFGPSGQDENNMYFRAFLRANPVQYGSIALHLADGTTSFKQMPKDEWMKGAPWDSRGQLFMAMPRGEVTVVQPINLSKNTKSELPTEAKLAMANCRAEFSPDNTFVVYKDAGALLVRDIKPIDTLLAKKLLNDDMKAKAISNAKQVALGFLMYGADMDDILPGAEGWENKLDPYMKDRDLMKQFNYTFRGGDMTGIDSPATTELGFVVGPGGRAVAYVDGHVKWIPNP